jgi:predicted RNA binding protein YcfA (HicA-like mRNA interferase family)
VTKPGRQQRHTQKSMKKLLEAAGWTETLGGSHVVKMVKPEHRPITLPHDKDGGGYPVGLSAAILRQAGLKEGGAR